MSIYNGEKYLSEAVESILGQTLRDFDFIIVDDGSTDNTLNILHDYEKEEKRIKIIENSQNIGLTRSLNNALKAASGKYIARMDADDISSKERLEKQADFLDRNPGVAVAGSDAVVIDDQENILKKVVMPHDLEQKIKKRNYMLHGSLMFRKNVLKKLGGYDEEMRYAQDYELLLRISNTHRIGSVDKFLYTCRQHGDAILNKRYFKQIFYTALAKTKALHNKNRDSIVFFLELAYCYGYIYKMGIPYLLRRLSLIK